MDYLQLLGLGGMEDLQLLGLGGGDGVPAVAGIGGGGSRDGVPAVAGVGVPPVRLPLAVHLDPAVGGRG